MTRDANTEKIDEPLHDAPDEATEIEPAISAEQPGVGAALGVEAFGTRDPGEVMENDEDSHVSPSDNDGETVPG